jgi:hypothetical protein
VKLCAFKLLELDGEDYRAKPLAERKTKLIMLIRSNGVTSVSSLLSR